MCVVLSSLLFSLQCFHSNLCWELIEKLIALENENRMFLSISVCLRDVRMTATGRWMFEMSTYMGCLELGSIVSLTDAGEKKLYCVSVHYLLLLLGCVCVVLCCCGCPSIGDFHLVVHSSANRRL